MKYVTQQFVSKITAPILCRFDGEELPFENGKALAMYEFDKNYIVDEIKIEDDKAVIELKELPVPYINSIGEEMVSGDDWIKEHKERFGVEPNLFDGA